MSSEKWKKLIALWRPLNVNLKKEMIQFHSGLGIISKYLP